MEEADAAKEWFVTHEGQQFGPVSIDDLKFEVERGELNPRLDMVWKAGMEEWIPAGELDGLFEKNQEAKAAEEKRDASGNFSGYVSGDTPEEIERAKGKPPGAGRGSYFFMIFVFPFLLAVGIGAARLALQGRVDAALLDKILSLLLLVPIILSIVYTLKRFQNLGMTRWWYFGLLVPLLNLWLQYRLFACPAGHAYNKKLDGLGWFLAILYWLFTLAVAAFIAAIFYFATSDPDKLREWIPEKQFQEFSRIMEKAAQGQAQPDAPESGLEPPAPEPAGTPY